LVNSIGSGVAGIVVQPYRGAQKGGAVGFGKGILTGTLGVVTKPTSGLVDFVTKIGEGFEN
jgi:vacuolar protein sorting-associated protein 13A/C